MKLGRNRHDSAIQRGAPRLAQYMAELSERPPACEYLAGLGLPSFGNDVAGDCTMASFAALVASWTHAATGRLVELPEVDVLAAYSALTGYDADRPETDTGAEEPSALDYLTTTGIAGHRIAGHALVDHGSRERLMDAIWILGGLSIDVELPDVAQDQIPSGRLWLTIGAGSVPGSWGAHEAAAVGYTSTGIIVRTWGQRLDVPWEWVDRYVTGAWAMRSRDFLDGTGLAVANGLDLATWDADLARMSIPTAPLTLPTGSWP